MNYELKELLTRIAEALERIEKNMEIVEYKLGDINETLDNILANDRGTYNP